MLVGSKMMGFIIYGLLIMNLPHLKLLSTLALAASLSLACAHQSPQQEAQIKLTPAASVASLYDYRLTDANNQDLSITQLLAQLKSADIIMVGEWHGHPGVHLFQAKLLAALAAQEGELALSMEHFTRADQTILNQYLAGEIGESTLIKKAKVWDNYKSDYRPMVEIARLNKFPVIAANAPRKLVKCVGQKGPVYLNSLDPETRKLAAQNVDISDSPYREKFLGNMGGMQLSKERIEKMFGSQLTWDATMAESMVLHHQKHPKAKIYHVAGRFHVINGLGTGAEILKLNPNLKIAYISASTEENSVENNQDYRLHVQSLPPMWISKEERNAVFAGHKRSKVDCS